MTNQLLKPVVKAVCDAEKAVKAGVAHDWTSLGEAGVAVLMDVPAIIQNAPALQSDLQALLNDPSSDADLLAYVAAELGGESAKVQKIIAASAKLLLDAVIDVKALADAIQSPAA